MKRLRFHAYYFILFATLPAFFLLAGGPIQSLILSLLVISPLAYLELSVFRPLLHMEKKAESFAGLAPDEESFQLGIRHLEFKFESAIKEVMDQLEKLKEVDQAKSEFLSIVSHELRTPLTSIKGSLGLLNSGALGTIPNGCKRMLQIADVETERLIYLISELLDLAKIEARQLSLAPKWASLDKQLENVVESLLGLTEPRKISIIVETETSVDLFVDEFRLKQIIQNLLSNAIKHSPNGSQVKLRFLLDEGWARIEVIDYGPGIEEEDLNRIFEKFTQASHPSIMTQGTGLGLTIARELVQLHGGKIHVESKKGQGAMFYFLLPDWRLHNPAATGDDERENQAA